MEGFHAGNGSYIHVFLQVCAKARDMNGDLNVNRLYLTGILRDQLLQKDTIPH